MSGRASLRPLLAAALLLALAGCSRLDPRVSQGYKDTAKSALRELDNLSQKQDDLRQNWDGKSGVEQVIWTDQLEIARLMVKEAASKRKTRGDQALHGKLVAYFSALGDEGISLVAHIPPGSPPRTQPVPELERAADHKRKARAALAEALRD